GGRRPLDQAGGRRLRPAANAKAGWPVQGRLPRRIRDGRVSYLRLDSDPATLRAAFTRNGGEGVDMRNLEFYFRRTPSPPGGLPLVPVSGLVRLNGKPLADAEITLVPLTSLRDENDPSLTEAKGRTDADGNFTLRIDTERAGARPGKYRVTISKKARG